METDATFPEPLTALPQGRFSGPVEFANMIRLALATAAQENWREVILCDANFSDWPLGERAVAQSLNDWAKSGRKLTLLASNYDFIIQRHARFVTWRQTWAHIIECRKVPVTSGAALPSALWSPHWVFRRLDLERSTGIAGFEPARATALREQIEECLRKSAAGFPSTTLGI